MTAANRIQLPGQVQHIGELREQAATYDAHYGPEIEALSTNDMIYLDVKT